jgi:hypothetical protein
MGERESIEEIVRLATELSTRYRNRSPLFYEANKILHIGWGMLDALDTAPAQPEGRRA